MLLRTLRTTGTTFCCVVRTLVENCAGPKQNSEWRLFQDRSNDETNNEIGLVGRMASASRSGVICCSGRVVRLEHCFFFIFLGLTGA